MAWPNGPDEVTEATESKSKWWTVKTYYKKSCQEVEQFHNRENNGKITITNGFRWCEYNIETNDGEFPKFSFTNCPGGSADKDSMDLNSPYGDNIETSELVSMDDGGCWYDVEIEGLEEDEEERIRELVEEDGIWALEEEDNWLQSDTEWWIWGPIEIKNEAGDRVRIIGADPDGNVIDFKEE